MSRNGDATLDGDDRRSEAVHHRLRDETVAWLTTVAGDGTPQTSPIWFLWNGDEFLLYSLESARVRNIGSNPRVSLNLDGNGRGGDIVVVEGTARIDRGLPPPAGNADYLAKYGAIMERNGWSPEWFGARYSVPILITPSRFRYW